MENYEILRFISAFSVGVMLSISGSLTQIITRNNLASPSTLGFNALIVLVVLMGQFLISFFKLDIRLEHLSFIMSILFVLILFKVISKPFKKEIYSNSLSSNISFYLLCGLCFNLFCASVFALMQFIFMTLNLEFPSQLWFGSFRFITYEGTLITFLSALFIFLLTCKVRNKFWLLSFSENFAYSLGEDVRRYQRLSFLITLIAVSVSISFNGVFLFFALVVPLILRRFPYFSKSVGNELREGSIVSGILFSSLDLLCEYIHFYGAEIPVGLVSSCFGSVVLMVILINRYLFLKKFE